MMTLISTAILLLPSVFSFQLSLHVIRIQRGSQQLQMSSDNLKYGVAAALSAFALSHTPVLAANYGGFGSTYAEVVSPKEAVLNEELAKSDDVKAGLSKLQTIKQSIAELKAQLLKDNQLDVPAKVKALFNRGEIRTALNKFNTAFSEDTQRGTDRLIRTIIQDVTELEREGKTKDGKQRSPIKVNNLVRRLDAMSAGLSDLAAFLPGN